ncbi:MAG: riboflavin synthase [Phycisphaerales bacterium]
MFTGLVQAMGRVAGVERRGAGVRLLIDPLAWDHVPEAGESICVSGCCLTVVGVGEGGTLAFDVIPETLEKTTIGAWREGGGVNLEHACRADTLLGGHLVQGHVDGVGEVVGVETRDGHRVRVRLGGELMAYLVPKGSVCVDGVSLTLASVAPGDACFEVALIPETLERTTLKGLATGDRVNVECDQVAKTIVHTMRHFMQERPHMGGSPG